MTSATMWTSDNSSDDLRPHRTRPKGGSIGVVDSRLRTACVLAGVIAGIVACASGLQTGFAASPFAPLQAASVAASVPNLYETQRQVDEYIHSGRYDEDVAKVVTTARAWLDERSKTSVKPAIVLDIDETSLSNWPAYRLNGWGRIVSGGCDLQHGPCGLRAWQALGQAKALAPTLALARRARELGVAVFFISGRPPNLREATERNLREQGYEWTGVVLLPEGAQFASAADFKAPERRKITEEGYTIVLSLGDQESDLKGGYAERTFKLPNPIYYLP
jgi:predicted secreted acid phosphatase